MEETRRPRYYTIGEVSRRTGLAPHVLRFWETEFEELRPLRTPAGVRKYREEDILLIEEIRHLVHVRGYTLEGARRVLRRHKGGEKEHLRRELLALRGFLMDLLNAMSGSSAAR